jgi:hypothetical protein
MTSIHHLALETRCESCNKPHSLNPIFLTKEKRKKIWVWLPYIPKKCSYCGQSLDEIKGEAKTATNNYK